MMGLDEMGELEIPMHLLGQGDHHQGGMTEEDMINAAI
jgi:hypothetical protein